MRATHDSLRAERRKALGFLSLFVFLVAGCRGGSDGSDGIRPIGRETAVTRAGPAHAPFTDITAASGIRFVHVTGGAPPLNILETAGAGGALFDANGDGKLDILLVNGRYRDGRPEIEQPRHALYLGNGDGTFRDGTARAGLGSGYGMGCAVADIEGDGDPDLYLTQFGQNHLYLNRGDATFVDVTATAGVAAGGWSTSAAFADYDRDGDLDLFVARYLKFTEASRQLCRVEGVEVACPPRYYAGQRGILFRNDSRRTAGTWAYRFTDVSRAAGVTHPDGKGLGCLWSDVDDDGDPDLYVANDGVANNLYQNDGGGRFTDVAAVAGCAYSPSGSAEGSMGVDAGDYDGDGRLDLFVGNFQNETDALYHNESAGGVGRPTPAPGGLTFSYRTDAANLGDATRPTLTFGVGFLDYDHDGRLDLFAANGHVQDAIARIDPSCTFPQPRQLFRNVGGGRFRDMTAAAGGALTEPAVGRGAAFGDWDNDGDIDILVTNNGGAPMLLRNEGRAGTSRWLSLRLIGRGQNRDAIGARVRVRVGDAVQLREVRSGQSYASASDTRLHFGMGDRTVVDEIEVWWPDGSRARRSNVAVDRHRVLRQSDGH